MSRDQQSLFTTSKETPVFIPSDRIELIFTTLLRNRREMGRTWLKFTLPAKWRTHGTIKMHDTRNAISANVTHIYCSSSNRVFTLLRQRAHAEVNSAQF